MRERKTLKETDREDKKERKKRKRKERLLELLLLDLSLAPIVLIGNCTPVVHTLSLSHWLCCVHVVDFFFLPFKCRRREEKIRCGRRERLVYYKNRIKELNDFLLFCIRARRQNLCQQLTVLLPAAYNNAPIVELYGSHFLRLPGGHFQPLKDVF